METPRQEQREVVQTRVLLLHKKLVRFNKRGPHGPLLLITERIRCFMNLEVKMITGRLSGSSDIADELALRYARPFGRTQLRHVSIERLRSVRMVYHHIVSETSVPAGARNDDAPRGSSVDRSARTRSHINAIIVMNSLCTNAARKRV